MEIAITGGTGFIGQEVLEQALEQGYTVRALTRRDQHPRKGVEWIRGDLADEPALVRLVAGSQAVLHIAGVVSASPAGFNEGNVRGTARIVQAAQRAKVARFILVSSLAAREPQLSAYGRTKREGEQIVEASGLDWTIVRPPAVYGPRDTEVFQLFKAAKWGVVPVPRGGRTSLVHVSDLARLLLALLPGTVETLARIFEPDDGRPDGYSNQEFASAIGAAIGRSVWTPGISPGLFNVAAMLDQTVRRDGAKLTSDRARYMVHPDWVCSRERQVPPTVWEAKHRAAEGLRQTAGWYKEHGWL